MAGNANSGRRAQTDGATATVEPGRWPWETARKRAWNRNRIRRHLEAWFVAHGLIQSETARDAIASLADAHHLLHIAGRAIDGDPADPKVGTRNAYSLQAQAHGDVRRALVALGVWPLRRPGEAAPETDADAAFKKPSA